MEYFNEWDVSLFGWTLTVTVCVDPRPSYWCLLYQWYRAHRVKLPWRGWLGSHAALTLCVGPFAVDVLVMRKVGAWPT